MAITFARRMQDLRASDIRELLKVTVRPEMISFAGGLPAPEFFPLDALRAVADRVLGEEGEAALQYSTTEGHAPLRQMIAERMNRLLGTCVAADEVLVTCGSQQALDLTGKLFLDEGDVVVCESPTYIGAIGAFRAFRPRFVEVPTDDDGMLPEALAAILGREPRARLVYVVPDFQNPTGRSWSLERRRRLVEVVTRFAVPVIEDCPYGELRFAGRSQPPLKALGSSNLVVFLGTFSKILCPGLRLGWLAAPPELREKYVLVKQGADLHTSTFSQRMVAACLDSFDLDANLERVREAYGRRRDAMLAAIDEHFPSHVRVTRPQGGLFLWAELPRGVNAREALAESLARNVAFVPGGSFFPNGGHENTMRLNFSCMDEGRIEEGIRRLGAVLHGRLAAAHPPAEAQRWPVPA
jgi:2-aminoadipate transaminase